MNNELDGECIFCKIIRREIPSVLLLENDKIFAFMDINPVSPGHSLVIPKFHTKNILEAPEIWASSTIIGAQRVACAIEKTLRPDGINILQANGLGAAQSIFHLHMHIVPRKIGDDLPMNWDLSPGNIDEMTKLAKKIRSNF